MYQSPKNVSKKFQKISHPELELSLYLYIICKEVRQITNWQTYKKFRIIWNWCANTPEISQLLEEIPFWSFWGHSWDVYTLIKNISEFLVCLSVDLLSYWNYTNIEISPVLDETTFWIFWRHSWDVGTLVPNKCDFFVCVISLLVVLLPYWN